MKVKLVIVGGKNAGREVPILTSKFLIGRAEECQLRSQSKELSRRHALLEIKGKNFTVRDCGSRNGTYVNGERINTLQPLQNEDELKIGPLIFQVQLISSTSKKPAPPATKPSKASKSASEDLDIFEIFGEEAPSTQADETAELQAATDTQKHKSKSTSKTKKEGNPASKQDDDDTKRGGLLGTSSRVQKPKTESSRAAAEEMLRKFMRPKP